MTAHERLRQLHDDAWFDQSVATRWAVIDALPHLANLAEAAAALFFENKPREAPNVIFDPHGAIKELNDLGYALDDLEQALNQ